MRYLIAVLLVSGYITVQAQEGVERQRFFWGVSAGPSYVRLRTAPQAAEGQGSLTFPNIKIGRMLTPDLAFALCLPGTVYSYSGAGRVRDRGFEGVVPGIQYWPATRWWIQAGAGLGMDAPAFYDIQGADERRFYLGVAALAATGYEVWHQGRFVLDMQARAHIGNIRVAEGRQQGMALSVMAGLNWY